MKKIIMITVLVCLSGHGFDASAAQQVFNVVAFGAVGDGRSDDGPAIQQAIDAAIAAGPGAEVALEAGKTYRLGPQRTELAALRIGKAKGMTIAGNGATLLAHPANRTLSIFDSSAVVVRDLTLDYNPLPYTQAKLTKVDFERGVVQFRVEPGYADPAVAGEELYRNFKTSDAVFIDGATRAFTHDWGRIRGVKALGDHGFEAGFHVPDFAKRFARLKAADFIAIKLHFGEAPARRDGEGRYLSSAAANIYIGFSRDVRCERIISHAAPVMTFVSTGSEGVVLDGCQVVRKPGTDRLIAGCSDGAHLKSLTVMPQIRNSTFEAVMDDSINIKISSEVVRAVQGMRVRLSHGDIATDDLVIQPGQTLVFQGGPTRRYLGSAKVAAVERIRYREAWITLDKAIPGLAADDLAFLKPVTDAVVSHCEFRSQLKTALLTHPPSVISDCRFTDVAYGVHAFNNDRIEGPPPSGLRVSRCEFVHSSVAAIALHLPALNAVPPGSPSLLAEDCQITVGAGRGVALNASNQRGMVLRDVRITPEDGRTRADLIKLRNCPELHEERVTIAPAF